MSVNKVDYDVLESAQSVYREKANELDEMIRALVSKNEELQSGWVNETSKAFIERFETDHKRALESVRDALDEISKYIKEYEENRRREDIEGAGRI